MINSQVEVDEQIDLELEELLKDPREIVLYNDDHNTFAFVIECLMEVCKHSSVQAEQCAVLVHYTGKCAVKRGDESKLLPMCSALLDRGLSAEIK
jgi:ATP-dependent Clp protease adaptor protein ClpS